MKHMEAIRIVGSGRAYAYFKEGIKAVDTERDIPYVEEAAVVTPRRRCHV
jgi:hypothetical protein